MVVIALQTNLREVQVKWRAKRRELLTFRKMALSAMIMLSRSVHGEEERAHIFAWERFVYAEAKSAGRKVM